MKKYIQFINESLNNFIFAVNIKDIYYEDFDKLFNEIEEKFPNYEDYGNVIDRKSLEKILFNHDIKIYDKPWALVFNVYKYPGQNDRLSISWIKTSNWGAGIKYMEDIINVNDFLSVGFDGVEALIKSKSYNL